MHGKVDVVRVLMVVFAIGLLVSGVTSYSSQRASTPQVAESAVYGWQVEATETRQGLRRGQ